jgi:hypothetical protein
LIALFKNRSGNIKFGDYAVAPNEATYNSVADIPNNSYASLTAEQLERYNINSNDITYIFTGIETPTDLETLKGIKRGLLSSYLNNIKEVGYSDVITGINLSGTPTAYDKLTMLTNRLNVKANAGNLVGHTQNFTDIDGAIQELDGLLCLQLLDRFADWYEGLYFSELQYNALINSKENETDLNNITFE